MAHSSLDSSEPEISTEPSVDVLAIGHALVDVLCEVDDLFLENESLVKGSMNLIDPDRAAALYGRMGPAIEQSGGSAANTATGVAACGGSAAFAGVVADDELGAVFAHDIRAAGVIYQTPPLTNSLWSTGRSMILITPDGERTMNTLIGASSQVRSEHLDAGALGSAAVTYVEGYLFDDAHPLDIWREVVDTVHRCGRRFSITLSDSFCVERHRDVFLGLLDGSVDICFGNGEELRMLFDVDSLDKAIIELAARCAIGAITLGSQGSVLVAGNERIAIPATPVDVIDTTGAGDVYAAGVLTGLARAWDLDRCGALGSKAAGAIVGQMGARLTHLPQYR